MNAATEQPKLVTQSTVLKRGWTAGDIQLRLGAPDREVRNPHYSTSGKMRLFDLRRVEEAESAPVFAARIARRRELREAKHGMTAAEKDAADRREFDRNYGRALAAIPYA